MLLIEFPEDLTEDDKLLMLFALHNVNPVKVDELDKPMIIMALNRNDIALVTCDDEGKLVIEYHGDEWETNE